MDTRSRRPILLLLPLVVLALAACGPSGASGTTSAAPTSVAPASDAPASEGPPSPVLSAGPVDPVISGAPTTGQTDTDWGRIWDAVPTGFPTYPGSTLAEDAGLRDVSGAWALEGGDPAEMANWFQAHLEQAAFSTESLSGPQEDGSFLLDSVGEDGCKVEVQVAPTGGLVLVSVKYGAACPNV
jgi:hypothetical protein